MLHNATPYAALDVPLMDPNGRDVVVMVVKGTFQIDESGELHPAEEPSPIRSADEPWEPDNPRSSLRYPSDICLEKRGTDVVVLGEAISRSLVTAMDVAVKVRGLVVPLRVHGERVYYDQVMMVAIGPAAPFERKPIRYEKAYGGATKDWALLEPRNWSGVGVAKRAADLIGTPAPQIEHPSRPHKSASDRHPPVGFGAIPPVWSPRKEHAGTFDDVWLATRMPLMPLDFDIRYNNVAHPSLIFEPHATPGDPIAIMGMSEDGLVSFRVPPLAAVLRGRFDRSGNVEVRPPIDTLLIEPARRRVEIAARHTFPVGRGLDVLREITVELDV